MIIKQNRFNDFPNWDGKRLLIADDAPENLRLLKIFLKSTKACIDTASNGKIAVDKFENNEYDLVVLDINMPVLSGIQAVKEMKSRRPLSKIVACTGTTVFNGGRSFEDFGFDSYLRKPLRLDSILTQLRPLLTQRNYSSSTII